MARIRTIKPGFFQHEQLSALDAETQLLAAGLLCYADDDGYFNANPGLVRAAIFPLRNLKRDIQEMMSDLQTAGWVRLGLGPNGRTYGHVINFLEHQRVSHPQPSEISGLEISWNIHGTFSESSVLNRSGIEKELKGKGSAASALPDWIPSQTWTDFVEMRKKLRKPLTAKATQLIIAKLAEFRANGHDPETVLNNSIEGGWQGVFEPKTKTVTKSKLDALYGE